MSSPFQKSFIAKSPLLSKADEDFLNSGKNGSQDAVEISNDNTPIQPSTGMAMPSPKLDKILNETVYSDHPKDTKSYSKKEINRANQEYKDKTKDPEVQNKVKR